MTIIYLLSALIIIFIISRLMKNNKIDAFTNMLSVLGIGMLLGAASHYIVKSINEDVEKTVVGINSSNPTQNSSNTPVVWSVLESNESVSKEEKLERDILIPETEGLTTTRREIGIQDDS